MLASRARAARPGTCGSRTGRGAVPRPSPDRRRTTPSCSGAAARPSTRCPPGRATGTSRRTARPRQPRCLEPRVGVAGVVHDQVEDDPDAAPMCLGDEVVEILLRAEQRVDALVVADVVAKVETWRRIDRRQPDRVDAEPGRAQVVEMLDDPPEVAHAVAIGVGEAAWVDLVDDAALPPVVTETGRLNDRWNGRGLQRFARRVTSDLEVICRPHPRGAEAFGDVAGFDALGRGAVRKVRKRASVVHGPDGTRYAQTRRRGRARMPRRGPLGGFTRRRSGRTGACAERASSLDDTDTIHG